MEEEWRPIQDYPDYSVSNLGRVKSTRGYGGVAERILAVRPNTSGYLQTDIGRQWKSAPIHKLVATVFVSNTEPTKTIVDHKNGIITDNRAENLRWTTPMESSMNQGVRKDNTTGYKGVSLQNGKYKTGIRVNGVHQHLGYYTTPEEAHAVYIAKAKELHGEYFRDI